MTTRRWWKRYGWLFVLILLSPVLLPLLSRLSEERLFEVSRFSYRRFTQPATRTPHVRRLLPHGCWGKTFFVGFHKTSTSTISTLFTDLGLKALHDFTWRFADPFVLSRYDVFTDGCLHDVKRLASVCPRAAFVYNTRNVEDWAVSSLVWSYAQRKITQAEYPGIPDSFYGLTDVVSYGCDAPPLSAAGVESLLTKRMAFEARLSRDLEGKELLVWQGSPRHSDWEPLLRFMRSSAKNTSHAALRPVAKRVARIPATSDELKHAVDGIPRRNRYRSATDCIYNAARFITRTALMSDRWRGKIRRHCARYPQFCASESWNATNKVITFTRPLEQGSFNPVRVTSAVGSILVPRVCSVTAQF
jgi:hypothetical protein